MDSIERISRSLWDALYAQLPYPMRPDGALKPLTKKATYTIKHVRLNNEDMKRLRRRLQGVGQRMDAGYPEVP